MTTHWASVGGIETNQSSVPAGQAFEVTVSHSANGDIAVVSTLEIYYESNGQTGVLLRDMGVPSGPDTATGEYVVRLNDPDPQARICARLVQQTRLG